MRIYVLVPLGVPRETPTCGDTVDKFFVPGGTIVSVHAFSVSMNEKNFKDTWAFNPNR